MNFSKERPKIIESHLKYTVLQKYSQFCLYSGGRECVREATPTSISIQWTLVIVNLVLSPILFTNERCLLFSM